MSEESRCEACLDFFAGEPDEGGTPPPEVEAHLEACPRCAARVASLRSLEATLPRALEAPAPPADLAATILSRVEAVEAGGSSGTREPGFRERLEALWEGLTGSRPAGLALAGACAVLLFLGTGPGSSGDPGIGEVLSGDRVPEGAELLAQASGELLSEGTPLPRGVWLEALEGSTLPWPEGCRAGLARDSVFRLGPGSLEIREGTLEWSGHPAGSFRVSGGGVAVRVVGTAFRFSVLGGDPTLEVSEGIVELTPPGGPPRQVAAGSTWDPGDEVPPPFTGEGAGEPRAPPRPSPPRVDRLSGTTSSGYQDDGGVFTRPR